MAIAAYKDRNFKSKKRAAIVFNVLESTFYKQLSGIKSQSEARASSHKITDFEDKSLLKQLLDADK